MKRSVIRAALLVLTTVALLSGAFATADQAEDWININKDYSSQRYVDLDQMTPANVGELKEVCEIQLNEPVYFNSGLLKVGRTQSTNGCRVGGGPGSFCTTCGRDGPTGATFAWYAQASV